MEQTDDIAQKKFEEFAQAYKYDLTRDDDGEYVKRSTWKAYVAYQNGFVDGQEIKNAPRWEFGEASSNDRPVPTCSKCGWAINGDLEEHEEKCWPK